MTTITLIRHGQTDWNLEGRYQGHRDIPLNETGLAQAQALAARIAGSRFDAIYSSDLLRAHKTAQILSAALGLPVNVDLRLREIDQGQWEGMLLVEARERYQDLMEAGRSDPVNSRAPGGESVGEVAARMKSAVNDISAKHPGAKVLVVSHGLAVATVICQACGIPLQKVYEHIPENATPVEVNWDAR